MSSIKEKVATVSGLDSVRYELNLFWDLLNETNRGSDAKARSLFIHSDVLGPSHFKESRL